MTAPSKSRQATEFMINHVRTYQAYGKMMIDGVLCWSMTGEPIGSGDDRHFKKVAEVLSGLEASLKQCESSPTVGARRDWFCRGPQDRCVRRVWVYYDTDYPEKGVES